jgi:hypothetical protein
MAKKLIKRADGSYSQRGLWDNIRANKGSGKKPTKEMLKQEKKIKRNNLPKLLLGGLPTGAASGLSGASGAGGGVGSLSNMNNMPLSTANGPLAGMMKMLNGPLSPLMGMTMNAVTNMTDAIVNPERERRPVLQNAASYTFDNGGTVGGPKKKYMKVKGKRLATDSPEYKEYYNQIMADRAQGIYYNAEAPEITIGAKKMTDKERKELAYWRKKFNDPEWTPEKAREQQELEKQKKPKGGRMPVFKKGFRGLTDVPHSPLQQIVKDTHPIVKQLDYLGPLRPGGDFENMIQGNPLEPDSFTENILEIFPYANFYYGSDDFGQGFKNMFFEGNTEGTFNNALGMLSIVPAGKAGNAFRIPQYLETISDALQTTGTMKDIWEDNISPMFFQDKAKQTKPLTPMAGSEDEYAYGGMIDPSMYMQQMMYGSYAQGGQVPQNIPVEVEGQEMYEMPNGQMGEFQGPSHENGGIPVALPEGTKVYSDRLKVNGKTMAVRKDKREANIAKLEKLLTKNPNDKFVKEALKRQQETASLEEQSDMAMQEQANQQQAQQEQAMMQEQMMGQLMQDPAMMQQMGMMMYGGKLNKLANGGEPTPINPLPIKQIYDLRYPNKTIDIPYNERFGGMYNNKPFTQEMFPLNNNIPNPFPPYNPFTPEEWETMTNTEFIEGEGFPLTGHNINSSFTNPDELNKFYDAKLKDVNTLNRKSSLVPTVKNNYLEEMADLAQRASGSRGTAFTYYPNDYDGRDKQYPSVVTFGGKSMHSYTNKAKPITTSNIDSNVTEPEKVSAVLNSKTKVADTNPPFLTEEQLNKYAYSGEPCEPGFVKDASGNCVPAPREVSGVDINKAFRKGGTGQIEPPGVNPYDVMNNIMGNTFGNIALSKDPYFNTKGGMMPNLLYNEVIGNKMLPEEDPKKPNKFMNFLNKAVDQTGDFFTGMLDKSGKPKKSKGANTTTNPNSNYDLTEGDRVGMAGTSVGMYGPAAMTMLNKMATPKNINFFSTFGQDALRTQEEAEGLAGISKDEAYRKNLMRANALRKQLANSARGVNDIRSGQLSAALTEQEGARGILGNYLQGMAGLKGQRAQLQQQIDQTRMGGEYQRDLADRQDIDQYYTNLAENVANASNMMQKQGKDLNVAQYNKDVMALSKAYSKYGVYAVRDPRTGLLNLAQKDANGNVVYLSEDEVKELPKATQTTTVKEDK